MRCRQLLAYQTRHIRLSISHIYRYTCLSSSQDTMNMYAYNCILHTINSIQFTVFALVSKLSAFLSSKQTAIKIRSYRHCNIQQTFYISTLVFIFLSLFCHNGDLSMLSSVNNNAPDQINSISSLFILHFGALYKRGHS